MRLVLYLESIIYFFLTGYSMEKTLNKESQRPFAMVKDTHELLKYVKFSLLTTFFEFILKESLSFNFNLRNITLI